ncbi:MAG: hypothetical protein WCO96_09695 [Actinomycetes bacterium]
MNEAPVVVDENEMFADLDATVPDGAPERTGASGAVTDWETQLTVEASPVPPAFVARTAKLCHPSVRPVTDFGEVHAPQLPPSVRHSSEASFSPLKVRLALVPVVALGGAITGAGGAAVVVVGPKYSSDPDTDTGVELLVVVPSPSCPRWLSPQHLTAPVDRDAQVEYLVPFRARTLTAFVIPLTATGVYL